MNIRSIEIVPVRLPLKTPARDSLGTYEYSSHGIVIIRDEDGCYGLGEIALAWFGGTHAMCREVQSFWVPQLLGRSLFDMNRIESALDHLASFSKRHLLAKAGIEMALHDLLGKRLNVPAYQLFGGKMRDFVALNGGVTIDTIDRMTETACLRVSEGFGELKIKVGLDDDHDARAAERIRQAVPDRVRLRVDANMAWKEPKRAKAMADVMAAHGVHIVEQPLGEEAYADLAWLRERTSANILLDESVWDIGSAKRCLDSRAGDLLNIYVCEAGGMRAAQRMFQLADLYGTACTMGSMPEGAIGASASLHLAVSMPNLAPYGSDISGFNLYAEDVVNESYAVRDGRAAPFEAPGLGVTLNEQQLARLRAG